MGGINTSTYVANPMQWIDPLGLAAILVPAVPAIAEGVAGLLAIVTGIAILKTAEELSAEHKAAGSNRDQKGYGGNCSPDQYDKLSAEVDKYKILHGKLGGCKNNTLSLEQYKEKMKVIKLLIEARENLNKHCFAGGDAAHQDEVNKSRRAYDICNERINNIENRIKRLHRF